LLHPTNSEKLISFLGIYSYGSALYCKQNPKEISQTSVPNPTSKRKFKVQKEVSLVIICVFLNSLWALKVQLVFLTEGHCRPC
jgi:hypothetical protein